MMQRACLCGVVAFAPTLRKPMCFMQVVAVIQKHRVLGIDVLMHVLVPHPPRELQMHASVALKCDAARM